MRVLVTGATSGLGRNAVELARRDGCDVVATGRNAEVGRVLEASGSHFVAADLTQMSVADMRLLMRGVDALWHCAALSAPWGRLADFRAINTHVTERLAQAAIGEGVGHFVHISTPSIYFDYRHRHKVSESWRAARPANAYVRTKMEAEDLLCGHANRSSSTTFIILRPRALFGRHDRVLLPRLWQRIERGHGTLRLPRGGAALMDMTYIPNVVHAMQLASRCAPGLSGEAFNITNHEPRRLLDVLTQLFAVTGGESLRVRRVPYGVVAVAARAMTAWSSVSKREPALTPYSAGALHYDMTLDGARAIEMLGYRPRYDLDTGIAATAAWVREHGVDH